MAQGRSTKIISMIKWIRTNRLSIKNSLSWQMGVLRKTVEAQRLELQARTSGYEATSGLITCEDPHSSAQENTQALLTPNPKP